MFFDTEREYKLCSSTCVLLIEIIATINLYLNSCKIGHLVRGHEKDERALFKLWGSGKQTSD